MMDMNAKKSPFLFHTRLIVLVALIYVIGNISVVQAAKINPTGRDIELTTLLRVSDSVLGEASVTITADDEVLLPKESTLELLTSLLSEDTIDDLRNTNNSSVLSQQNFQAVGLDMRFDSSSFECIISIPADLAFTQQIRFANQNPNRNHLEPEFFSGYMNVTLSANETRADETETQNNYYHRLESALSAGPANIEYEASYDSSAESNEQYVREGTRLNLDFPNQGTRIVLGDMYNSGKQFQDGTDILGVGLTRDFTLIPTRNVRPKAAQSFTLQRTSSVDVVIDGAVVQRLTLSAGSYNLSDIPLAQGNNDVELIITDSAGREERISFSIATGNGLLAQGEFEYSVMAGVPSELRDGEIKYLSEQQILHGYLDVGVTPSLTLGVDAQSREELYQYGASILHASSLGVTELVASQSHHPELKGGDAYRLSFDAEFDESNDLKPQLSFIYEYQSEDFVGISSFDTTDSPINTTQHYASLFSSIAITQRLRTALTTTYSSGVEESNNYWSVSPSLSGPLFGTPATWSTRLNYRDYQDTENEFSASFTISWPFSRELRAVGQYSSQSQQGSLDMTYRDGIGSTGGVSAYASLETNEETDGNFNAGVNYTGNRFETLADHTTRVENFDESNLTHNTRVEVSSSIAFAGSAITIGRPVKEAFAVIEKHPSLAENRVAVDPTLNSDYARVFSESSYDVLLPDLVAYNSQLIGYDVEDLPPGYDLGDGAFSLYPGYNRGYRLVIGSDAVLTAMGKIYDRKSGDPITLVAGKAIYLGDKEQEPVEFFTNRQGLFALSGLRPGEYKLELDNKEKQSVTVNLPEDSNVLVMLGDLYVD